MRITRLELEHHQAIHRLLEIVLREQEQFAGLCSPPEDADFFEIEVREHLLGLQEEPEAWRIALDSSGEVIGVVWLRFLEDQLGRYGTVRQVIVDPDHRGRGIGTRLLSEAERCAREAEAVMLLISALRPNPAWKLYRSLEFSIFPAAFREDSNPEHVVLWKWFGPHDPPSDHGSS